MLCNSKTNKRPDKLLQKTLIKLSLAIIALTISVIMLLLYPEYFLYLVPLTVLITSMSLILTIKTLDAGEEAMCYGGFANEIIRNDFKIKRIDNSLGEAIIQNDPAKDFFKDLPVMEFIEQHIFDNAANKSAFYRLQSACNNLSAEKIILSLVLHQEDAKIFDTPEWFEITVRPMFLKKTDIFEGAFSIKAIKRETYLYWTIDNITAAKNMEQIFSIERKSLHDFLDDLPVGLYTTDKNYNIEYTNNCLANFLGYPHEKLQGKNLQEFLAPNGTLPSRNYLWKGNLHFQLATGQTAESFTLQQSCRENEEIKIRGVVINNLPTEPQLKNNLNEAFDKISWLFNFAPVGIIFTAANGLIKDCNQQAHEFLDCDKDQLLNRPIFEFIKEEDILLITKEFEKINQKQSLTARLDVHIYQHNTDKIATVYISPMKKLYAASTEQNDGLVLYLIDSTKQKSLEQQFAQAQKMQAVGQLAGGVAHDFNNLLTAMIGFCDLLLQRHGVGDPSFADLIQIKQNANRAAGLVRQLLAFSRKQPLKPKFIDTTENFTELSHMLKRILGEQITLKFHHGKDLGYIKVDPVQFSQVIINLAVNAKDAMEMSGTLNISTRTEVLNENYQFGDDIIKPGEFVVIDVADTGCGIPPENLTRIFDPFFSTKQNVVGSGTGLGLAMVYGIVRQTEGFIRVDSQLGVGTTFSIHLPRFETNPDEEENISSGKEIVTTKDGTPILTVQEKLQSPISISQKLIFGLNISTTIDRTQEDKSKEVEAIRIIFVEDEDSVRTFGLRALKKKGYDVIGCNSAENALSYLENDKNFGLLITDMVMPGISGAKLTTLVKEQIPEIKVILASGYSEEIVRQELDNFDNFEFLTKPYSLGDLTAKVFEVLTKE